jgi:CRP-like cAMP-binding protein
VARGAVKESGCLDGAGIDGLILSGCSTARRLAKEDKALLYAQGTQAAEVFLILEGFAKVSQLTEDGAEITTDLLKPGDIAGFLLQSAGPCALHETQARAVGRSVVRGVGSDDLLRAMQANARLSLLIAAYLARSRQAAQRRTLRALTRPVDRRVAETLVELAHAFGAPCPHGFSLEIRLTLQDIADLVGASRSVVSTGLNDLRSRGLLDYTRDMICVNESALAFFASQARI